MTPTELRLFAQHRKMLLPLADICEEYFGVNAETAGRKASLHALPVPAWRLIDSKKAPLLVHLSDLARLIDERSEATAVEHAKSQV